MTDAPSKSDAPKSEHQSLRVLVADDNPSSRIALRAKLAEFAFEVIAEAADTHEAAELFLRHNPDILVVAAGFPPHGGFELLQYAKQTSPRCILILTTAAANPFVEKTGRLLGATEVCPLNDQFKKLGEILSRLRSMPPGRP